MAEIIEKCQYQSYDRKMVDPHAIFEDQNFIRQYAQTLVRKNPIEISSQSIVKNRMAAFQRLSGSISELPTPWQDNQARLFVTNGEQRENIKKEKKFKIIRKGSEI